jgi:hypothetical protein
VDVFRDSDSSHVGLEIMVPDTPRTLNSHPDRPPSPPGPAHSGPRSTSLPGTRNSPTGGLASERQRQGFQSDVIDSLQQSVRGSSAQQYERLWAEFVGWCSRRKIDPATAPVKDIIFGGV